MPAKRARGQSSTRQTKRARGARAGRSKSVTAVAKRAVASALRKRMEVKKHDYNNGIVNINHNNFSAVPLNKVQFIVNNFGVNMPSQGDMDTQFDGNEYNVIGVQFYYTLKIAADRLNSKFRVLILRCNANKTISAYGDIFDNVTGNIMIDPIDKGKAKVLYDRTIGAGNINPSNSTDDVVIHRKFYLKGYKYPVKHEDNGSSAVNKPMFRDHMFVFGFDSHGSIVTDTIGQMQIIRRIFFTE